MKDRTNARRHKSMDQLEFEIHRSIIITLLLLLTAKENGFTRLVVPDFKLLDKTISMKGIGDLCVTSSQAYIIAETSEKKFWLPPSTFDLPSRIEQCTRKHVTFSFLHGRFAGSISENILKPTKAA